MLVLQLYGKQSGGFEIVGRRAYDPQAQRMRFLRHRRFTTYETIEVTPVLVVKNNGMRQAFNAEKVRNGIIKSCEKRPVPMAVIDEIVADISKQVYNSMESEITSKQIGEMVMERLKKTDEVAYVRYASVYRSFKDISSFMAELQSMMSAK